MWIGNRWEKSDSPSKLGVIKILDGAEKLIFARIAGLKDQGNNDVACTAENGRCFSQAPGNFRRNHAQMETRLQFSDVKL